MKIQFVCHEPRWDLTDDVQHTPPPCGGTGMLTVTPWDWEFGAITAKCPVCRSTRHPETNDFRVIDHELPVAVGVLALRDGQVLGVSRKNDHKAFGIPGGKVDPTDGDLSPTTFANTVRRTAVREFYEETGIPVAPDQLEFLYQGLCPGGADGIAYWMVTFKVQGELPSEPLTQPGEGVAEWVTWETLERGPFGGYNTKLRRTLEIDDPPVDLWDLSSEAEHMATRIYDELGIPLEQRDT